MHEVYWMLLQKFVYPLAMFEIDRWAMSRLHMLIKDVNEAYESFTFHEVYHRLHDPNDFRGQDVLVVGGGDSALEASIALAAAGSRVTVSYRKPEFSRPKPENIEKLSELVTDANLDVHTHKPPSEGVAATVETFPKPRRQPGSIRLMMPSQVTEIRDSEVVIQPDAGQAEIIPNDAVFTLIGRKPPLEFFRRSGVRIRGEWRATTWISLALILAGFTFVYHWKKSGVWLPIYEFFSERSWFPFNVPAWWEGLGGAFADPATLVGTLRVSIGGPGFYYTLAYCVCMVVFGVRRIRRRRTPYVKAQTLTLVTIQVVPLFLLPYVLLPWLGNNGCFNGGVAGWIADQLFPLVDYGQGREHWRAFGLVLAWPLFFHNIFTSQPLWGWLIISFAQTFLLIPLAVRYWGKGAYCGWVCSCGGMAETLGDTQRHKMPHGPKWNRLNMVGQFFLALTFLLLITRILSWIWPGSVPETFYNAILHGVPGLNYVWFVDLLWAGILGFGLYWHFSGRVWCRFACPLAALMHIYARFSRFRILADKKMCISCNVGTSVCNQCIEIRNFANKGFSMQDPQCVRCSACVQACPTGVLTFGQVDGKTGMVAKADPSWLAASAIQISESTSSNGN